MARRNDLNTRFFINSQHGADKLRHYVKQFIRLELCQEGECRQPFGIFDLRIEDK